MDENPIETDLREAESLVLQMLEAAEDALLRNVETFPCPACHTPILIDSPDCFTCHYCGARFWYPDQLVA